MFSLIPQHAHTKNFEIIGTKHTGLESQKGAIGPELLLLIPSYEYKKNADSQWDRIDKILNENTD